MFCSNHDLAKALVGSQLIDEYQKWLNETENRITGSKQEMENAIINGGYSNLPQDMRNYLSHYASAVLKGQTTSFVTDQANIALKNSIDSM